MNAIKLSELAAQKMSPQNHEAGGRAVEASIAKLRRYANIATWGLCYFGAISIFLSILSACQCFYFVFEYPNSLACFAYLIIFLVSFFFSLLSLKLAA